MNSGNTNTANIVQQQNERQRKIQKFVANKSRFVSAKEYEGQGKVLVFNSDRCNPEAQGKYGQVVEYKVKDLNSNTERIVNASAVSLVNGIEEHLSVKPAGTDVMLRVRKTGVGSDTRYTIEEVVVTN